MPPTRQQTRPGPPKLSELARVVVAPAGIVSTGWPAIRQTCADKLGVTFDPWQEGAGRLVFAKRADGLLAAMIDGVGMSLPRQVGKTYLIGASVFALCVNTPGLLVIWTAHHARTHGETFLSMQAFAERARVAPFVRQVLTGSGDEEVRFHNGSRILFGARERGFGRGIPGVDVLVADEAQILSDKALANMLATLNTSRLGLVLFIGTPPKPGDMSEAFSRMREDALSGRLVDGAWIEFGADRGADPTDRKQWARANPSYPRRTPPQSILRLQRKLTVEDFLREALGIWDAAPTGGAFAAGAWRAAVTSSPPPMPDALGVAADLDQTWLSLGAAGLNPETGKTHLGSVQRMPVARRAEFVAEVRRIQVEYHCPVGVDGKGPASFLIPDLLAADVQLAEASLGDYVQACADLRSRVEEGAVEHGDYADLTAAVEASGWRTVGDRRVLARKKGDISSLEAVALAMWAAFTAETDVWGFRT